MAINVDGCRGCDVYRGRVYVRLVKWLCVEGAVLSYWCVIIPRANNASAVFWRLDIDFR